MVSTLPRFDKPTVHSLRLELEAAIHAVLAKRGVRGSLGTIRFTDSDFRCQFRAELLNPTAKGVDTAGKRSWIEHALFAGFKESDHGREIALQGIRFRIDSWRSRAPKRPVRLEYVEQPGKFAVVSASMVKAALR
jgi:hypothetical protein